MLKVVVYDGGFGGELFADYLERELPVVEVIRVIDWRNADVILNNSHRAREVAKTALRPYIGRVDLIIFANYLISATSLKHFRRKYKNQAFLGFGLKKPDSFINRDTAIITTRALARTFRYKLYVFAIKRRVKTMIVDDWAEKIDDGELESGEIADTIRSMLGKINCLKKVEFRPKEIVLALSQLDDVKSELREAFGGNVKFYDSFQETLREVYKKLKIRGGMVRK